MKRAGWQNTLSAMPEAAENASSRSPPQAALSGPYPTETTRPALFTALRTGFARELLQEAFRATRNLRTRRRAERGLAMGEAARGLGKLLVVAPDQRSARRYCVLLQGWMRSEEHTSEL